MAEFRWLHFSDLHWGEAGHESFWPRLEDALFKDFNRLYRRTGQKGWDAVFFTGDISNTGTAAQFTAAGKKIDRLVDNLSEYGQAPNVFFVPGNHDLTRIVEPKDMEKKQCKRNIHDLIKFWFSDDKSLFSDFFNASDQCFYRDAVEKVFSEYMQFIKQRQNPGVSINSGILPGDFSATIGNDDLKIGLVGLNSSFLHLESGDFQGRLDLDMRQLLGCVNYPTVEINDWFDKHDVAILLTHHPRSWLNPANKDTHNQIFAPGQFGLHLYGHAHFQEYNDIFLQGETENLKQIQSSALFSREEYEIWEHGTLKEKRPRIHGYSSGILYKEEQKIFFRLWPRSIEITNSGSQFFEKARGVVACPEKNDEGTAPVPVTCCRKQGSSGSPHSSGSTQELVETELNSIQSRVCMEIATCLEDSGIEDFKKQLQKQIRRRWDKSVETAFDIGKVMVTPLSGQNKPALERVIPALKVARDETIKATLNTGAPDAGNTLAIGNMSDNLLGWIMHLTVNPDWLEKNFLTLKTNTSAASIDVQSALGVGLVSGCAGGKCLFFEKTGKGTDWGAENFKARGSCPLPGADVQGADFENVVSKIKQHLYCQFVSNTPEEDPENLPMFETDAENTRLASHINMMKEEGWNIFIPFNKSDKSHSFQNPMVIEQLKADLDCLDIFIYNYSDGTGALLFSELDEIQVWLDRYFRNRPDT